MEIDLNLLVAGTLVDAGRWAFPAATSGTVIFQVWPPLTSSLQTLSAGYLPDEFKDEEFQKNVIC